MFISLYTSRVVLATLGVKDYGIYNVVGGVIAMFGVVSGSISNAVSRFITFELGKGNKKRLNDIFIASINIKQQRGF
jgi:O-antigen/teichoic acid export membrane protein